MSEAAYYFGCWGQPGHYLWVHGMQHPKEGYYGALATLPWDRIDGTLTPKTTDVQGAALLHQKDGWTALALHDYMGDRRGKSNSVFFLRATLDFDVALLFARAVFPEVVARIGEISEVSP